VPLLTDRVGALKARFPSFFFAWANGAGYLCGKYIILRFKAFGTGWPTWINRDSSVFGQDVQLFIIQWLIYTQFKTWIFETVFLCVIVLF